LSQVHIHPFSIFIYYFDYYFVGPMDKIYL